MANIRDLSNPFPVEQDEWPTQDFVPPPPRSFHIFISPQKEFAEVPEHFFENFKDEIPERVFFFDPVDTKIGIIFDSSSGSGYFTHGLYNILSHYYLHRGAWLRLMYLGRAELVMKVHNIYMQEVKYLTPAKGIDFAIQHLPGDFKDDTGSKE